MMKERNGRVRLHEIAEELQVPRHFLGKIMKRLVKEDILCSVQGHQGGFSINEQTLGTSLIKVVRITEGPEKLGACALGMRKCDGSNPCPLHDHIEVLKQRWVSLLTDYTIGSLLQKDHQNFIKSIATINQRAT